jgi:pantetheine-phosphate adenylyltransferase
MIDAMPTGQTIRARRLHQHSAPPAQGVVLFRLEEGERCVSVERIASAGEGRTAGKRVGLYPGTFDPVTLGHLDIVVRAVKLVDHLVIGIANNPSKTQAFSIKERIGMIRRETAALAGTSHATIEVSTFDTLLIQYARKIGASVIIRGLRAVSDFEYEFQMVGMNQHLDPEIETVFLMADPKHQAIASRLVKEIASFGGNVSAFTTPAVASARRKALREGRKWDRQTDYGGSEIRLSFS